jgi:hypothetical protein
MKTSFLQSHRFIIFALLRPQFFLDFVTLEDGTDRLSRNVGIELLLNAI